MPGLTGARTLKIPQSAAKRGRGSLPVHKPLAGTVPAGRLGSDAARLGVFAVKSGAAGTKKVWEIWPAGASMCQPAFVHLCSVWTLYAWWEGDLRFEDWKI